MLPVSVGDTPLSPRNLVLVTTLKLIMPLYAKGLHARLHEASVVVAKVVCAFELLVGVDGRVRVEVGFLVAVSRLLVHGDVDSLLEGRNLAKGLLGVPDWVVEGGTCGLAGGARDDEGGGP